MTAPTPPGGRLRGLLHNKPVLIGGGAAVVVALVLWLRSRQAAGAGADSTGGGATPGNPAAINTTGSDVASALSSYQGQEQSMLDEFGRSLQQVLSTVQQSPATTPGSNMPPPVSLPRVPPRQVPRLPFPPTGPTRQY